MRLFLDANILFAVAVNSRSDLLVTGDKMHFGSFYGQVLEGVRIVDLREAIAKSINWGRL